MTEAVRPMEWQKRSPLADTGPVSTVAETGGAVGISVVEEPAGEIVQVIALRGKTAEVGEAIAAATGIAPMQRPKVATRGGACVLWSGPGQWLVLAKAGSSIGDQLAKATNGRAAVVDQSGSRSVLRLGGAQVVRTMQKLIGLDVHPDMFRVGDAAMTDLAHVPVHVWRLADENGHPSFAIAAPRSYAGSVWHAVCDAAAEFGLEARTAHI